MYDLIIIGLGPAGFNASIYAKRAGLNVLVIEKETPGGKLNSIKEIENFIGYEKINGSDLALNFYKQFKALKIPMINEEVLDIKDEVTKKIIYTNNNQYETKAIIIGAGRGQKKLNMPHNIKGISYCALCDANLYQDKTVAMVGNNPGAIEETLYLSNIVSKIYLIIEGGIIKASPENISKLNKDNIEIIYNEQIIDIIEENSQIKEIILQNQNIKLTGLFVNLGYGPSTYFCSSLDIIDKNGYIITDDKQQTKVKGIYACGDIVKKDIYQIINAASEGAVAAINANKYIKEIE